MTNEQHWAADEAARKRLAAFGNQHGLSGEGILEILEIKKLSEHKGTETEAVARIAAWATLNSPPEPIPQEPPAPAYEPVEVTADEMARYDEAIKEVGSVPVFIRMDGRGHYDVSVQAWLDPALTRVGLVYARQALEDYQAIFGDVLIANGNGAQKQAPALTLVPPSGNGNTKTFQPQVLEYAGKSNNGSLYWKCKGHPFNQYGVTIWEESLPSELKEKATADLTQDLDITGWLATYSQKPSKDDPNRLVADKVVSLTKVA